MVNVDIDNEGGHIRIYDGDEEIVGWSQDEWVEDPEFVVPAIANAIKLAYEDIDGLKNSLQIIRVAR
jgi:hypothetical protein